MKPLLVLAVLLVAACREDVAEVPPPASMTDEALSFFCQMNVSEHGGPKGQIHLDGMPAPLFFAQVRDLVAYLKSPERSADIAAIYVSDMGVATAWNEVGPDNWIAAQTAHFVVDAGVKGGMGAPEIVPFADEAAAQRFVQRYGGSIVDLDRIPDAAALAPVDLDAPLEDPA